MRGAVSEQTRDCQPPSNGRLCRRDGAVEIPLSCETKAVGKVVSKKQLRDEMEEEDTMDKR